MKNIWTNGCFDVLHMGHIELFKFAKSLGDKLIVGIDSDQRVKSLKGEFRPINDQYRRKTFLESIIYIDGVVVFSSEDELKDTIKTMNITTIVVGDDYYNKYVIGSEYSDVKFFPRISGISTTSILSYFSS